MLSLLVWVCGVSSVETASDYFPLATGTTWTYEESIDGSNRTYDQFAGNEQEVGGKKAGSLIDKYTGHPSAAFYRVEEDTVLLVAFDQNVPLERPYPVLKLGPGKNDFRFSGTTQWFNDSTSFSMTGSCKRSGQRDVLGTKRDVVVVTIDYVLGTAALPIKTGHQTSTYAKGVGLVEMVDVSKMNKTKSKRTLNLVAFKGPGE